MLGCASRHYRRATSMEYVQRRSTVVYIRPVPALQYSYGDIWTVLTKWLDAWTWRQPPNVANFILHVMSTVPWANSYLRMSVACPPCIQPLTPSLVMHLTTYAIGLGLTLMACHRRVVRLPTYFRLCRFGKHELEKMK